MRKCLVWAALCLALLMASSAMAEEAAPTEAITQPTQEVLQETLQEEVPQEEPAAQTSGNPFLGHYTLETAYVSPLSSATFEYHAEQMNGVAVELTESAFTVALPASTYTIYDPVYQVQPADSAHPDMLAELEIDDEALRRAFDSKLTISDAYGNQTSRVFLSENGTYWMFDVSGTTAEGKKIVLYAYTLQPY